MKEIDQYASMGFAIDIDKGTDLHQTPPPLETAEIANEMNDMFGKYKPVLGIGYSERIRKSNDTNQLTFPKSPESSQFAPWSPEQYKQSRNKSNL